MNTLIVQRMMVAILLLPAVTGAQTYSIGWSKIAGGGGTAANGSYTFNGTVGQPDAGASGTAAQGPYAFTGGFWAFLGTQTANANVLGLTSLVVGPAAGSNSVVLAAIPATNTWLASASASWLHLSAANQSGTGSANVIFNYDANTGPTRIGTLTIGGQTLTVTQAGSTYVAARPQVTLAAGGNYTFYPIGLTTVGSGNVFFCQEGGAVEEWSEANNTLTVVVPAGTGPTNADSPGNISSDGAGNLYFSSTAGNSIKEWIAASNQVVTLVTSGLVAPYGVAVDVAGSNVDVTDNNGLHQWTRGVGLRTLVSGEDTFNGIPEISADALENIFIAAEDSIDEWIAASGNLSVLIPDVPSYGIAVDGGDNFYFGEYGSGVYESSAASSTLTMLASNGGNIDGVAVDGAGNVYYTTNDYGNGAVIEVPNAFVDPTPKYEPNTSVSDVLPPVVPSTQSLLPPFVPTSDQPWLTISSVSAGVVSFSLARNASPYSRTGHINLLGQSIAVTQLPALMTLLPTLPQKGVFQFVFSSTNSASTYKVLSATNLLLPVQDWTIVGMATNIAPDLYQFDIPATDRARFYIIRSP